MDRDEGLIRFLRERTGECLRGVGRYDADGYEVLYVRPGLERETLDSEVERMVTHLRSESRPREVRSFPYGDLDGTVRSFEEAVVMHFPLTQERGVVVTLEPDVARQLTTFMRECIERL
ncbi:hypothetical protein NGM10_15710 (plasmid) [Halorussus salilacus]|uniref:DUF7522 family protein n=1 Tax=Halorussus salilacus TaxID=2953750 RepID=UPI0020A1DB46|nr:hypothetical protein [Halorussus salilacus]USZ69850.1 hypothetical protein NGM10_15710 [Halorussus salilacus]